MWFFCAIGTFITIDNKRSGLGSTPVFRSDRLVLTASAMSFVNHSLYTSSKNKIYSSKNRRSLAPTLCMSWHKTSHYINKYPLPVPVNSWPAHHTHLIRLRPSNLSIKFIIFLIFYYIFVLFIAEFHMRLHLPTFYHNDTLLYCILSF
jgi:hypothetical protein